MRPIFQSNKYLCQKNTIDIKSLTSIKMRLVCLDLKGHCICCTQQLFHYSVEGMSVWVSFLQFSRLDDNQPRPNGEKYLKFKRLKSNLMIEIKYETQKLLKVLFSLNVLWTVVKVNEELCFFHRIKIFIKFWRIVICQKKIEFSEDTPQTWKICPKLIFDQM